MQAFEMFRIATIALGGVTLGLSVYVWVVTTRDAMNRSPRLLDHYVRLFLTGLIILVTGSIGSLIEFYDQPSPSWRYMLYPVGYVLTLLGLQGIGRAANTCRKEDVNGLD